MHVSYSGPWRVKVTGLIQHHGQQHFGGLASVLRTGTHMVHQSAMQTKFSIMDRVITMASANAKLKRFTSFLTWRFPVVQHFLHFFLFFYRI